MQSRDTKHATFHFACAGFSIAEVLTAVVIAAILCALAAPRLPAYQAEFQIGGGARQIAIDLQRTRMRAVGENVFYRVVFNMDGSYVMQSSADGITYVDAESPLRLPSGVSFVSTFGGLPQPRFSRLGTLAADARLTIKNSIGQTKVVQMNTLGKITIS